MSRVGLDEPETAQHHQRRGPRVGVGRFSAPRWVVIGLAVAVLAVSPVIWSYVRALSVPGGGSLGVRTVDWLRQEGLNSEVAWVEDFWYSHHPPPVGGKPAGPLAGSADVAGPTLGGGLAPPAAVAPIASPALPGEGQWHGIGGLVHGVPALYAAYLRPDTVHTSLTAGVVWIDPHLAALRLVAGSVEPGGSGWPDAAPLSPGVRSQLLATFNSGFRLGASNGGFYAGGRTGRPLVDGAASLVISRDGSATVGAWGRDVTMTASVAAVRQNLSLIVDKGAITPGVYQNSLRAWGATVRNEVLVWRSGIGVTDSGALVYAAGPGLSIASLAGLLQHAGAVRAMELDINSAWVSFVSFDVPPGGAPDATDGTTLLPGMAGGVTRYLGPATRDFLVLVTQ